MEKYDKQLSFSDFEGIGIIGDVRKDGDYYISSLKVFRLSGVSDIIPLKIPVKKYIVNNSIKGRTVKVKGEIENLLVYDEKHNSHFNLFVYVKSLETVDANTNHENKCHIMAFICRKLSCRCTPKGRVILDMNVAVNHRKGCYYLPIIVWGKNANSIADNNKPGDKVELLGRFQSREYDKNNITHTTYEISASTIYINDNNESML